MLVTGGLGFIGSAFIRRRLHDGTAVVNVDNNSYAADDRRLRDAPEKLLSTVVLDVTDPRFRDLVADVRPSTLVHFAAETHVTRSELAPELFERVNVHGTRCVLEAAALANVDLVVHVSTDEVYGPCLGAPFREEDKQPGEGLATSPYARSKAVADDAARSYADRLRVVVIRPTNCYGPWQHPEKAVPRWITRALRGLRLPVWGDGRQVRDWMHVEDACSAIELVMKQGTSTVYNVGPEGEQVLNLEIARAIAHLAGLDEDAAYLTAYDRPNHDRRYAIDSTRLRALGWSPEFSLDQALRMTVEWYALNRDWWEPLLHEGESIYSDEEERTGQR